MYSILEPNRRRDAVERAAQVAEIKRMLEKNYIEHAKKEARKRAANRQIRSRNRNSY